MRVTIYLLSLIALVLFGSPAVLAQPQNQGDRPGARQQATLSVYLFWTRTCPHCAKARDFLERLAVREPRFTLVSLELSGEERNERAFVGISQRFKINPPSVPVVAVADEVYVGYDEDGTTGAEIENKIKACLAKSCTDIAGQVVAEAVGSGRAAVGAGSEQPRVNRPAMPATIRLPGIGDIETRSLSLPALTILLGAVDGFNPCAMWVLVFLIGLLVGMQDQFRMWSYGAVFLVTSALVYFAFMAAWLNLFLVLGSLAWIRFSVGLFALGAGTYYLREFLRHPEDACAVTSPGQRQRLMDRLRGAIAERSFLLAILGIVTLAVAVNAIELLCSAGIPAVYTQVLAMSDLSRPAYFGYLLLYISVFLLDDIVVFVTAMLTLQATGLASTYARYSHLIGGVILGAVGLLLMLKPEWLSFS